MDEPILSVRNVKKSFGVVKALTDASIDFHKGKVNMLFGENGAGKSTLMNIITGLIQPDEGELILDGKKVNFNNILQSSKAGIQIIHQEIKLSEDLSVAENIFLNDLPTNFSFVNYKKMYKDAQVLLNRLNPNINAREIVSNLSIAEKQLVEIAKALSKNAKIIIMDEPTSSIGEQETKKLFEVIKELKQAGIAIVYITHRMKEIESIGDYITIFRDGTFVSKDKVEEIQEDDIITRMVGRKLTEQFPYREDLEKEVVMSINNLSSDLLTDINLEIRSKEILVFAGLVGSGRTELAKTIIGDLKSSSGSIRYLDDDFKNRTIKNSIKKGIFYVSEDRKKEGLVLEKTIEFNISLSSLKALTQKNKIFLSKKAEKKHARYFIEKLKIRAQDEDHIVKNLSGGNQQKVSIAKGLLTNPKLIIFDEPTRGVDVGARKEIYEIMNTLKKDGVAVVVISSDLQEVLGIADRIIVMNNGEIKADLVNKNVTQEDIIQYALKGDE